MSRLIRVAGCDMALANLGLCQMMLDVDTMELKLEKLELVTTSKQDKKTVRQNSDDLRRSRELTAGFRRLTAGCTVCFAEIPTGAQNARAATAFGIAIGILAGSPIPIIEVSPNEVKLASLGKKTATKSEIIAWATKTHPHADWLRVRGQKNGSFVLANEHLADACAIVSAGIRTQEFISVLSTFRSILEQSN